METIVRFYTLLASFCFLALGSAASGEGYQQNGSHSYSDCRPHAPLALVARPSDLEAKPANLSVEASAILKLVEAKFVMGRCVPHIVSFVAGNARLSSGKTFVVRDNGTVELYPPQGIIEAHSAPATVNPLLGYSLVTSSLIGRRRTENGTRMIYVGIFRGKSNYLIGRFDVINGKSSSVEPLIRATSPISALGFLPAPDTADASIGFMQSAGPNKAWLYAYSWHHGAL